MAGHRVTRHELLTIKEEKEIESENMSMLMIINTSPCVSFMQKYKCVKSRKLLNIFEIVFFPFIWMVDLKINLIKKELASSAPVY